MLRCTLRDNRRASGDPYKNARRVMAVLMSYSDDEGELESTLHDLACHAGMSAGAVAAALQELQRGGGIAYHSEIGIGTQIALCGDDLEGFRCLRNLEKEIANVTEPNRSRG